MLFVYKPHITGPEGAVTTPDMLVDYLHVDGAKRPLALLTSEAWQQASGDETVQAGYAVTALGGGALVSPVSVLSSGLVVVARSAWRLSNLDGHITEVTLNGIRLAKVGLPQALIDAAGGTGDALPRGFMLVQTAAGNSPETVLHDPVMDRSLSHRVMLEDVALDRWGADRPHPRYSIGPTQKDVPHYI